MKKLKNILFVVVVLGLLSLTSCTKLFEWNQPKEVETEYSSIHPMGGEWYVVNRFDDGSGVFDDYYGIGHTPLFTYNTADESTDEMWINDDGNFWSYTLKCPINLDAMTFGSADSLQSSYDHGAYDIKVVVQNGKIIKDGGTSPSGVKSDSIYFEIQFEDDPGNVWQISGIRRTGFIEDEY
jgi:hypothetical protein